MNEKIIMGTKIANTLTELLKKGLPTCSNLSIQDGVLFFELNQMRYAFDGKYIREYLKNESGAWGCISLDDFQKILWLQKIWHKYEKDIESALNETLKTFSTSNNTLMKGRCRFIRKALKKKCKIFEENSHFEDNPIFTESMLQAFQQMLKTYRQAGEKGVE